MKLNSFICTCRLNQLIEEFALSGWTGPVVPPAPTPPVGYTTLSTAFDNELRSAGWTAEWDSEEEEEVEMAEMVDVRYDGVEEAGRRSHELAV